jgi:hypothetical protein
MATLAAMVAALALLALVSCVSNPQRDAARVNARVRRAVEILKAHADADSLAAAGLLLILRGKLPEESRGLMSQAVVRAPTP